MYFLGSANRTRGLKKMGLLRYEIIGISPLRNRRFYFFWTDLDPDGCLVADQRKVYAIHLKYREQRNQRGYFRAGWWPCKKLYYFCDGQVFFIDRGLLMGALIEFLISAQNYYRFATIIVKNSIFIHPLSGGQYLAHQPSLLPPIPFLFGPVRFETDQPYKASKISDHNKKTQTDNVFDSWDSNDRW